MVLVANVCVQLSEDEMAAARAELAYTFPGRFLVLKSAVCCIEVLII